MELRTSDMPQKMMLTGARRFEAPWSLPTDEQIAEAAYADAKRVFDIIFSLTLLIALLPVLLIVAVVVAATSPGPVLFRQTRVGKDGVTFTCLKFRSMVADAEVRLKNDPTLAAEHAKEWKLKNDPRVTTVGNWMRKTSIDELPQLFNILRGDMSVVGPRPVQPKEMQACYGPASIQVVAVKPGLTGLWQVSGRSAVSYEDRVALDIDYIVRRSLWLDLWVVVMTIPAVLMSKGAI